MLHSICQFRVHSLITPFCFFSLTCSDLSEKQNEFSDVLAHLQSFPQLNVKEIKPEKHFNRIFEIRIIQPINHNNPLEGTFSQKIYLSHVDTSLPVAFETEGYSRHNYKTRELADLLKINQLMVEHRYYGESVPSNHNWEYLNIWQAAQDHHVIVELFKEIYPSPWVSSGASKGGDTAIFHRRFFPNDVDATVAYVAPILFELEDQRFLDYYQTQGDEPCRSKINNYRREMLKQMNSFTPYFEQYVSDVNRIYNVNMTFSIPYEHIVYHAIREDYIFEFWSSETEDCSTIPGENASTQALFDHFVNVFDIFLFFSDYGKEFWTPWLYQAKTELGNYAFDVQDLADLTLDIPPLVTFSSPTQFDPTIMQDIDQWVRNSSNKMIFIYGENDPWTVASFSTSHSENSIKIINPKSKHSVRIKNLPSQTQTVVVRKLIEWLDL